VLLVIRSILERGDRILLLLIRTFWKP